MISGIRIKVCGLTNLDDAAVADRAGADYLGFIHHEPSPRHVPLESFRAMRATLPARKRVVVMVEPTLQQVGAFVAAGADLIQAHFPAGSWERFAPWLVEQLGPERVWLAPRTREPAALPAELLAAGKHFLIDAYVEGLAGGTGRTTDWAGFAELRRSHRGKVFILAGGLSPENVAEALAATDARWLDVNSGVERAPGLKDPDRVSAFAEAVRAAVARGGGEKGVPGGVQPA